jgi:hypothetical protein
VGRWADGQKDASALSQCQCDRNDRLPSPFVAQPQSSMQQHRGALVIEAQTLAQCECQAPHQTETHPYTKSRHSSFAPTTCSSLTHHSALLTSANILFAQLHHADSRYPHIHLHMRCITLLSPPLHNPAMLPCALLGSTLCTAPMANSVLSQCSNKAICRFTHHLQDSCKVTHIECH